MAAPSGGRAELDRSLSSTVSQTYTHLEHPASPSPPPKEHRTHKRHQIRRSITEFVPPGKRLNLQAHHPHSGNHYHDPRGQQHHHHHQTHRRPNFNRNALSQDVRGQLGGLRTGKDSNKKRHPHVGRYSFDMERTNFGNKESRAGNASFGTEGGKEEDLKAARQRATCRADGLKSSLLELHSFSVDTTKQLDDTYYSLLLKLSALQTTMTSIKELAETSQDIASTFDKEARDLEHEIVSQIGSLGRFDEQQSRIEDLQGRIESGRDKIAGLSGRVEAVREMVEGWESADREWQEKTRRKMKVIWSVVSGVVLALVLLAWGMKSEVIDTDGIGASVTEGMGAGIGKVAEVSEGLMNSSRAIPDILRGKLGLEEGGGGDIEEKLEALQEKLGRMKPEVDHGRLRALDEL